MAPLQVFIDRLREEPTQLDFKVRPEELDLIDEVFTFDPVVRGQVTFTIAGQDVIATGDLHASATGTCVRCLEPAHLELHVKVAETWMPRREREEAHPIDEDAELTNTYVGEVIEPGEVFRELLMAELPLAPHCAPDCKGLCPGCGANLNAEPCRCAPAPPEETPEEPALPAWKAKLKNLKL